MQRVAASFLPSILFAIHRRANNLILWVHAFVSHCVWYRRWMRAWCRQNVCGFAVSCVVVFVRLAIVWCGRPKQNAVAVLDKGISVGTIIGQWTRRPISTNLRRRTHESSGRRCVAHFFFLSLFLSSRNWFCRAKIRQLSTIHVHDFITFSAPILNTNVLVVRKRTP